MNILTDKLPETVSIDGEEVPINWDFRYSIQFSNLIQSPGDYTSDELVVEQLKIYYPTIEEIDNLIEAYEKMIWFFMCGEEGQSEKGSKKPILSYEEDGGYIFAAFLEQYDIDLQSLGSMHWWRFRSLLDSLKDDTQIVKIMGYRGMDIGKLPKEQKAFYKKMQRIHSLKKDTRTKEDIAFEEEIAEALVNGGSIEAIKKKYDKG